MKIVFLDSRTVGPGLDFSPISDLGDFTMYNDTPQEMVIERLAGVEAVIVNKTKITKEVIDACPSLKLVCVAATGTNNIDMEYALSKGLQVKNVAGYSTDSVVQLTYGLLISLMMHIQYFDRYVKSGEYGSSGFFTHYGRTFNEIAGKRIGIVGMGTIGKRSAEVGTAFGAEVVYYSTSGKNNSAPYQRVELDELIKTSDVIMVHAPLNKDTHQLINRPLLRTAKNTAYVVNTGRGMIINEAALVDAVVGGGIAGAALDVYDYEPLPKDGPIYTMPLRFQNKFIFTPHIAWCSIEARTRLIQGVANNIKEYLNGDNS
ncbi:MAG: hydroxyacid dehydrogenase [Prevotellaceae bacterium]|jgi:glycerate dehydrogenase|nr:hydroxyacid dehydrogenase [Prevotellaceae bacterium]